MVSSKHGVYFYKKSIGRIITINSFIYKIVNTILKEREIF